MNKILSEYYTRKWNKSVSYLRNNSLGLSDISCGLKMCHGLTLSNTKLSLCLAIEFDKQRPEFGIYYGIRTNKSIVLSDDVLNKLKQDYFNKYWRYRNPGSDMADMYNVFLPDDGDISEDGTYWPFWIRLEEKYDLSEAIKGISAILYSFLQWNYRITSQKL